MNSTHQAHRSNKRTDVTSSSATDPEAPTLATVARMVDMRIPLPYLLTAAVLLAGMQAGQYYALQQVQRDMAEMKVILKSNDGTARELQQELAVQKFRLTAVENELAMLKGRTPR